MLSSYAVVHYLRLPIGLLEISVFHHYILHLRVHHSLVQISEEYGNIDGCGLHSYSKSATESATKCGTTSFMKTDDLILVP